LEKLLDEVETEEAVRCLMTGFSVENDSFRAVWVVAVNFGGPPWTDEMDPPEDVPMEDEAEAWRLWSSFREPFRRPDLDGVRTSSPFPFPFPRSFSLSLSARRFPSDLSPTESTLESERGASARTYGLDGGRTRSPAMAEMLVSLEVEPPVFLSGRR
jgi:hypothetical protein